LDVLLTKYVLLQSKNFGFVIMTFSREKKAQLSLQAAQKRKSGAARLQVVAPPNKALKAPPQPKNVGVNTIDYCGHDNALNFPLQKGSFTEVQLCYKHPREASQYPSTEAMNDEITELKKGIEFSDLKRISNRRLFCLLCISNAN
jgi:hypothetical protein